MIRFSRPPRMLILGFWYAEPSQISPIGETRIARRRGFGGIATAKLRGLRMSIAYPRRIGSRFLFRVKHLAHGRQSGRAFDFPPRRPTFKRESMNSQRFSP
jgi:hypothetical protein